MVMNIPRIANTKSLSQVFLLDGKDGYLYWRSLLRRTMALLIEHHFNELYAKASSYARRKGHPDPENVAADAIAKALQNIDKVDNDVNKLTSYILTITHNKVIDYYRSTSNIQFIPFDNKEHTLFHCDQYFTYQYLTNIKNIIRSLNASEATVIISKFIHEMTDDQTASLLECSPATIRVTRHRAYKKIRRRIEHTKN